MTEAQAMGVVADVLGGVPEAAIRQTFGHCSTTYEVRLPDRSVILRMNTNPLVFATTERNIAALRAIGLPVPTLLAADLTGARYPFAYLLLERIPGRDLGYELAALTSAQRTRLAEQIVAYQRRVNTTLPRGTGYGYAGIGETGRFASWWEMIRAEHLRDESPAATTEPRLRACEVRIRESILRLEPYLRDVPPICFLDDVTVKNVLIRDGALQGLIDFDCVCYGDPLYWLALTATGVVGDVGPAGWFYVEELKRIWNPSPAEERALALYAAAMSLQFVRWFGSRETPEWRERMREHMEYWLHLHSLPQKW